MSQRKSTILLVLILILSSVFLSGKLDDREIPVSYWLWAGITAKDAPANSGLYVFQGRVYVEKGKTLYQRLGLYPHPIKSSKLFLVYRLEGQLPDAETVVSIFQHSVSQWRRHPVTVSGIQLDFASPTSKLLEYSHFLEDVRKQLPKEYELSITGLGDWAINGNEDALRRISSSADEVVFQLYQGRQLLSDIETYIHGLTNYSLPFRIGLLDKSPMPTSVNTLKANPHFQGIIYFIQKAI